MSVEAVADPTAMNGERLDGEHPDDQAPPVITLELEGEKPLNLRVGGTAPQLASARVKAKTIVVPAGQYEKDDVIECVIRLRCCNVSFPDKRRRGTLFTERKHDFECIEIERIKS